MNWIHKRSNRMLKYEKYVFQKLNSTEEKMWS